MININLLPKKSFWERSFIPLLIAVVSLNLLIGGGLAALKVYYKNTSADREAKMTDTRRQMVDLSKQRQLDTLTQDYNTFSGEIKSMKDSRRYWNPIWEQFTSNLPDLSRIVEMTASANQTVTLKVDAPDLNRIASYMIALQKADTVAQLSVQQIATVEKLWSEVAVQGVGVSETGTDSLNSGIPIGSTGSTRGTTDIFPSTAGDAGATPAASGSSTGDPLLDQLNAIIDKQQGRVSRSNTLDSSPASSLELSAGSVGGYGPITQKEIEDARKALEASKRASSPTPTASAKATPAPSSKAKPGSNSASGKAQAADRKVQFYEVVLEIRLKPLPASK